MTMTQKGKFTPFITQKLCVKKCVCVCVCVCVFEPAINNTIQLFRKTRIFNPRDQNYIIKANLYFNFNQQFQLQ